MYPLEAPEADFSLFLEIVFKIGLLGTIVSFNNLFLIYIQGAPRGGLPPGASGMRAPFPGGGGPGMIRGKNTVRNASNGTSIKKFQQ